MTCKPLHIPYKYVDPTDPTFMDKQKANWLAIERWSDYLIKTCLCDCGGGTSVLSAGSGCGSAAYSATSSFNVTSWSVTVDTDDGSDILFDLQVDGVSMDTISYLTGSPTPVTVTNTVTIPVTSGQSLSLNQFSGFNGSATITLDQLGLDDTLSWSGCG